MHLATAATTGTSTLDPCPVCFLCLSCRIVSSIVAAVVPPVPVQRLANVCPPFCPCNRGPSPSWLLREPSLALPEYPLTGQYYGSHTHTVPDWGRQPCLSAPYLLTQSRPLSSLPWAATHPGARPPSRHFIIHDTALSYCIHQSTAGNRPAPSPCR